MRTQLGLCAIALVVAAAVSVLVLALSPGGHAGESPKRSREEIGMPESVLASIRHRLREIGAKESAREDKLVRVTREPFPAAPQVMAYCRSAIQSQSPHDGHWIHVFVSSRGYDTMKTGKGIYPRGTVILKEKFADADGKEPVLFTGMLKREKGYAPDVGDWQFFVLDADATFADTGDMRSCIKCHVPYRKTDFVARNYLTEAVAKGR
jgi:Cytochrome P460